MVYNLKPYPAYKDSGVEWLGTVPEYWEVTRLKRHLVCNDSAIGSYNSDPGCLALALLASP